jgi:hypothetical protein
MSTAFPFVPLFGSSPYVYLFFAALIGLAFGWFLERSGFGSAKMLTSVFTLRNFQVYKVMFTALLTAMIGAQLLGAVGLMDLRLLEVNTTYILPMTSEGSCSVLVSTSVGSALAPRWWRWYEAASMASISLWGSLRESTGSHSSSTVRARLRGSRASTSPAVLP